MTASNLLLWCRLACMFSPAERMNKLTSHFHSLDQRASFSEILRGCLPGYCSQCVCVCVSCSIGSDSLWPHRLYPTRLLCPWDSPSKNTGMGCHSLLQGIFPTKGSDPCLLHCWQILYHLSHEGSPQFSIRPWIKHLTALTLSIFL